MAWFFSALGLALSVPMMMALVALAPSLWSDPRAEILAVGALGGVVAGAFSAWRVPFLLVLDHEVAHLGAAVLCLRRPVGLRVGERAGLAEYSAGRGAKFILMAPYLWPWLAWLLCPLLAIVQGQWQAPVIAALGAALGFTALRIALDLRPYQTDLQRVGLVPAVLSVLGWGPLLFAVPALFAVGGLSRLETWGATGWHEAQGLVSLLG
jgi:hypothetical protein